jgi:hypothetical protein
MVGAPTLADAILDRLVHNAHRIKLKGKLCERSAPTLDPRQRIMRCRDRPTEMISGGRDQIGIGGRHRRDPLTLPPS